MTPTGDLVLALEACVEAIRAEGVDAEAAIARFPELADELRELVVLGAGLEAAPQVSGPEPAFRQRLAAELAAAPPPRAIRDAAPAQAGPGLLDRLRRRAVLATAAVAAAAIVASVGAVAASANALPGGTLYPVKRTVERTRLWLASEDAAMIMHMDFAARRLDEALSVPGASGRMLADFSHEVTAALVRADYALAAGTPRERVAEPLLGRLLALRGTLIAGRPKLPPIAWRSALALVDEAIAALQGDDELTLRPVPRLVAADLVLARRAAARLPWERPGAARVVRPVARITTTGRVVLVPTAPPVPVQPALPTFTSVPPPTAPPPPPPPVRSEPKDPDPPATEAPVATAIVVPNATPGATVTPPAATPTPSPADTATPTPTSTPAKVPPQILAIGCHPSLIPHGGVARCAVQAEDPDGDDDGLAYAWSSSVPEIVNADQPQAIYYAEWDIGGADYTVTISVTVTDADGLATTRETYVQVTSRLVRP